MSAKKTGSGCRAGSLIPPALKYQAANEVGFDDPVLQFGLASLRVLRSLIF